MNKLFASRSITAAAIALSATAARAAGDAPATNLEGANALYMLLGGVAAMTVAIWILTIIIAKIHKATGR